MLCEQRSRVSRNIGLQLEGQKSREEKGNVGVPPPSSLASELLQGLNWFGPAYTCRSMPGEIHVGAYKFQPAHVCEMRSTPLRLLGTNEQPSCRVKDPHAVYLGNLPDGDATFYLDMALNKGEELFPTQSTT
jgi:hypothetical protein